ncbi:MAG: hypothetical protein QF415_11105 [Candidatus Undinarchaeales archaeon]|jgi:hypothetical protein|nr:hypothetical protein [Candidatus Undinarchaeales archaeon]MDP7494497.1 hypothetical protein [Candidatus Undinarchaeales archaeon]
MDDIGPYAAGLIDTYASAYENVYDISFGELPKVDVVDRDALKGYMLDEEHTRLGRELTEDERVEVVQNSYMVFSRAEGMYEPTSHTVLLMDKESLEPRSPRFRNLVAHELVHAYQRNRGASANDIVARYDASREGLDENGRIVQDYQLYPTFALLEGMADRMSEGMLEYLVGTGETSPEDLQYFTETVQNAHQLDRQKAQKNHSVYGMIVGKARDGITLSETDLIILGMSRKAEYGMGYLYADSAFKDGRSPDDLLASLPLSLDTLETGIAKYGEQ